ncbi:hypothetical protein GCM10010302_21860 [Streptomyces polychromogenes]|uniref:PPM-type phosphatase domain-containing protein n=2 Tax=Streptomyces TaxID=1883 RepID=A0ABN0VAP2_9ACTN
MHRPSGCPSCAEPLEEGDRFCGVCGYALSSPTPPPDRTPTLPDPGPAGGSADAAAGPAYAARVPAPAEAAGPDPTPGFGSPARPARVPAPAGGGAPAGSGASASAGDSGSPAAPGYGVPASGYSGGSAAGVPAPGWEGTPVTPGSAPAAGDTPWGATAGGPGTPYGGADDAHHGRSAATAPGDPYGTAPQGTPYEAAREDPHAARYAGAPRPDPQADPYPAAQAAGYGAPAQTAPPGTPQGEQQQGPYDSTREGDPQQGPYANPHEAPYEAPSGPPQGDPHQDPYGATPQGPRADPHEDPYATPQGDPQGSGGGARTCVACRTGYVDTDGYCEHCGHAQPRERDHQEEELCSVAAVSDRGLRHHRNEDSFAVAATALPDGSAATVAIVCDGVSSASRPDDASAAAAGAASEALLDALPRGAQPAEAMHEAILAAGAAVSALAPQPPGAQNAPACTLVGAVVSSGQLTIGWVGDSRAYWVPDDRAVLPRRLTEDDSWAAQMVAAGLMGEAEAYSDVRAHAITGWLGADAYDLDPHTASFRPDHPGVVVVCTDGLWNYAESAADMARILPADAAERPLHCAQVLVGHALDGGGHDNITVAVVPFTAVPPQEEAEPEAEAEAGPAAERPRPAA